MQADMVLYRSQAYPVLHRLNIYQATRGIFPYSPISMFIPALAVILSDFSKIPFHIIMKMPGLAGDVFIGVCLYLIMCRLKEKHAFKWALLYALNPVSILVTSFHGNIMALPNLFVLLAYAVLLFNEEKNYRLSALLLSVAIGLRAYPVLLLPLFLIKMQLGFKKKISYAAYCLLPVGLSFIPFLLLDYKSVLNEVFGYGGHIDFGLAGLARAYLSIKYNTIIQTIPQNTFAAITVFSKIIFAIFYLAALLLVRKTKLANSIMLVFLVFYLAYAGVAAQYLIWVLPFAFLAKDRFVYLYLACASWALINFYLVYHTRIIFGKFAIIRFVSLDTLLSGEFISMLILWFACAIWVFFIARSSRPQAVQLL
jgi:hypothetical protein